MRIINLQINIHICIDVLYTLYIYLNIKLLKRRIAARSTNSFKIIRIWGLCTYWIILQRRNNSSIKYNDVAAVNICSTTGQPQFQPENRLQHQQRYQPHSHRHRHSLFSSSNAEGEDVRRTTSYKYFWIQYMELCKFTCISIAMCSI